VGEGTVAVIDAGPDDENHIRAVQEALQGERVSHLLVTHNHHDHSPASIAIKAATGAEIVGCAPIALDDSGPRSDAGFDRAYSPDRILEDGEIVAGDGWTIQTVATPGHTSNHLCFALSGQDALFTGDHVMGWSTTVVSPPDGNMADYMRSLEKLLGRKDRIFYPTHGAPVENPRRLVRGLLTHRKQREHQILALLKQGIGHIPEMVERMYVGLDPRLVGGAGRSVLAHLVDLRDRGDVEEVEGRWLLRKSLEHA
jgi:glyoxylase-like metal-dependent hydrolase (beta-lactamase superfamily II)